MPPYAPKGTALAGVRQNGRTFDREVSPAPREPSEVVPRELARHRDDDDHHDDDHEGGQHHGVVIAVVVLVVSQRVEMPAKDRTGTSCCSTSSVGASLKAMIAQTLG